MHSEDTMNFLFDLPPNPALAVLGEEARFPLGRIFCVGRNYAAHAAEMGNEVDREAPFYFMKSAQAVIGTGESVPYPLGTSDLHHEMELVVAIGASGVHIPRENALDHVFGYGAGLDMTRRDLQAAAKEKRRPWDTAKNFAASAVLAPLCPAASFGSLADRRITLSVNGETRQDASLSEMVWSVPEVIAHLSTLYHLQPGDLIMTGTPAGVGPVGAGDWIEGQIDGLPPVSLHIAP